MELEAMQLLNLSPIPELSELELSTMLDHLSGLSDINGDLTDRHVEDILKEAEDLLDQSSSTKTHESISKEEGQSITENKSQSDDLNESKHYNSPISSNHQLPHDISKEVCSNKEFNSPAESTPTKIYSPGGSCNHIKSTIDSLKEFSSLIEKQLVVNSLNSSPKQVTVSKNTKKEPESTLINQSNQKLPIKQGFNSPKIVKVSESEKKRVAEPCKSIKLLNCFERLYQDKPVRLLTYKKPKVIDKGPKNTVKKNLVKDFKNSKKNSWQGKSIIRRTIGEDKNNFTGKNHKTMNDSVAYKEDENLSLTNKNLFLNSQKHLPETNSFKSGEGLLETTDSFQLGNFKLTGINSDKKLMLKVLEEMEEIKNQVKKVGIFSDHSNSAKDLSDSEKIKREGEMGREKLSSDCVNTAEIKRLEGQLSTLKEKYDHQIEKLESENMKLREALNNQHVVTPRVAENSEMSKLLDVNHSTRPTSPFKKVTRSLSLENFKMPKNSPSSSQEKARTPAAAKEAYSQTEKELKSASVQCSRESIKEAGTNENAETILEPMRKTENKENLRKATGKLKAFSDVHLLRQKKILFGNESQLLATIRGLQAEMTTKDRENKKLRNEIDSLKRQMKKLSHIKIENCKKCHAGTQTIGLGNCVQKPYNPENFEVPLEFEKENEELRSRLKALEEDFEVLKEKRITDLQCLHQVHEEEMAKVVSKLETQSALTRHLHSLLVNR